MSTKFLQNPREKVQNFLGPSAGREYPACTVIDSLEKSNGISRNTPVCKKGPEPFVGHIREGGLGVRGQHYGEVFLIILKGVGTVKEEENMRRSGIDIDIIDKLRPGTKPFCV